MPSIRDDLIRLGIIIPSDPVETAEVNRKFETRQHQKKKKPETNKNKSNKIEKEVKIIQPETKRLNVQTESLENLKPIPKDQQYLLTLIRNIEEPPKTIRGKIRWLVRVQQIYLNSADISGVRTKTAIQLLSQFERDVRKLAKYWQEVASTVNYTPDRYSTDDFQASWHNLCINLQSGKGIENIRLKEYAVKFLKLQNVEFIRLENVRQTRASLPHTPSEPRPGGASMLYVQTKSIRRR